MSDIRDHESYLQKKKSNKFLDLRYFLVKGIYEQTNPREIFGFAKLISSW